MMGKSLIFSLLSTLFTKNSPFRRGNLTEGNNLHTRITITIRKESKRKNEYNIHTNDNV